MDIEVQFYSPTICRVIKLPEGTVFKKQSLSIIKTPEVSQITVQRDGNSVSLKSTSLLVKLDLKTGRVSFFNIDGQSLFTEKDYGTQFTPVKDADKDSYSVRQAFFAR